MTIKEAEQCTGLTRSNIRFYEKEKLISPVRNENNGYREYSQEDVDDLKKIACLRTLGVSVEDIRKIIEKNENLYNVLKKQKEIIEQQIGELEEAKIICKRMLETKETIEYETMDIEKYITDINEHIECNRERFKWDSLNFLNFWGGKTVWLAITIFSLILAVFIYINMSSVIPVQWNRGEVSSWVDKRFIFAYPFACVIIRFGLKSVVSRTLRINFLIHKEVVTNYILNSLCFVFLSVEIFTIMYMEEIARHVIIVLFLDAIVLGGILLKAMKD